MDDNPNPNHDAPPLVYVIILNWNQPVRTSQCVTSIFQSDYSNYEVIVVDNGSDESRYNELIRLTKGYTLKLIRTPSNLGFSKGMNRGICYALENKARFILLLNNDTIIDKCMIRLMVQAFADNPSLGILGPVIYYLDDPQRVWFAGYHIKKPIYILRRGLHVDKKDTEFVVVDFVNGCGMMIRAEVFERVGLLPEEYFMYYEDLEYCLNAGKAGWQVACLTTAKMWHVVSASYGSKDALRKEIQQLTSGWIFFRRNTRGVVFAVNVILRIMQAIYKLSLGLISRTLV